MGYPLPKGIEVVRRWGSVATIQVSLPQAVLEHLAEALEYAGRMTGSDRVGAQLDAICAEVLAEWRQQERR